MNAKQAARISHLTKTVNHWAKWIIDGDLIFSVEQIGEQVLLFVKTENTKWYQKSYSANLVIGPRGGIVKKEEFQY